MPIPTSEEAKRNGKVSHLPAITQPGACALAVIFYSSAEVSLEVSCASVPCKDTCQVPSSWCYFRVLNSQPFLDSDFGWVSLIHGLRYIPRKRRNQVGLVERTRRRSSGLMVWPDFLLLRVAVSPPCRPQARGFQGVRSLLSEKFSSSLQKISPSKPNTQLVPSQCLLHKYLVECRGESWELVDQAMGL